MSNTVHQYGVLRLTTLKMGLAFWTVLAVLFCPKVRMTNVAVIILTTLAESSMHQ